jgi:hypothetical protein
VGFLSNFEQVFFDLDQRYISRPLQNFFGEKILGGMKILTGVNLLLMRIEIFRQRQSLKSKKLKSYILDNFATVSDQSQERQ